MKRMKKIVSLLAAAVLCLMPLANLSLTAHAAEPVTYYLKYLPDDNEWRYQVGSTWNSNGVHRELYYMKLDIRDGDYMVIEGSGELILEVNVRLGNLTINHATSSIITANGIDDCYVLPDSWCVINGDVTNAYIYDNGFCNFNNNVTNLEIIGTSNDINATVAVGGTVGHVKGSSNQQTYYELYNFEADRLYIQDGSLKTEEKYYSTTPQATAAAAPSTTAPAPSAPTAGAPAASTNTAASSEYDDVPKTGEANTCIWLLGIAAVCLLGRYQLNKR